MKKKDKFDQAMDRVIKGLAVLYVHPEDYKFIKNKLAKNPNTNKELFKNVKIAKHLDKGEVMVIDK